MAKQVKKLEMQGAGESISDSDFVNASAAADSTAGQETPEGGVGSASSATPGEEEKKDMATGEAIEPNLGDLGILESETARVAGGSEIDEDMLRNIRAEKANLNVRDSQIE